MGGCGRHPAPSDAPQCSGDTRPEASAAVTSLEVSSPSGEKQLRPVGYMTANGYRELQIGSGATPVCTEPLLERCTNARSLPETSGSVNIEVRMHQITINRV